MAYKEFKIDFPYAWELIFNKNLNSHIYFTSDKNKIKHSLILLWDTI